MVNKNYKKHKARIHKKAGERYQNHSVEEMSKSS